MSTPEREIIPGFIVLEGIDGTGTTTQLKRIETHLGRLGIPHWTSFEPTDFPTGRFLRQVLSGEVPAEPATIARLFSADRNEHLYGKGGAVDRLSRGELVVFDRYLFSSLAYQGMDCGLELPAMLNAAFPLPGLLVYFDLDVEIAMTRVARRPGRDIYETHAALERVRGAYSEVLSTFADSGMHIARVDASAPLDEVSMVIDALVEGVLAGLAAGQNPAH
ncbi:MAG: dTMP kinase [Spirochaetota bacterium]